VSHETYRLVREELDRAYAKHGREPWGRHEFYGILLEEVDELWDAVKRDEPLERVHAEAIQVAAMCFRYIETGDRYGWRGKGLPRSGRAGDGGEAAPGGRAAGGGSAPGQASTG
jgi:NTP pyrophosphatase (non-canonical NTP hydrolase)